MRAPAAETASRWWREAVVYHVYLRSFADADGDGVGDLDGVTAHLDHLLWLGVDALWLSPLTVSPDADWGYDVSDYRRVQPVLGGDAALDRLLAAAHGHGLRVLVDLVPNHTSTRHPWFREAVASPSSPRRRWYVIAPGRDGGPPTNWVSDFDTAAPSWGRLEAEPGLWYLHSFLPEQADLNWAEAPVRDEFDGLLRTWFARGVDGVRIDVAHKLAVDPALRDNPAAEAGDDPVTRGRGQRQLRNSELPALHDVLRRWRRIADEGAHRLLLGETWVGEVARLAPFLRGDELDLCLNVPFLLTAFEPEPLRLLVGTTLAALPAGAVPLWCGSNHDVARLPTRWAGGDPRRVRLALMLLLTLPGCALLYYGDEIGMPEADIPVDRVRDPLDAVRRRGGGRGRDGARTPMRWSPEPGAGFTAPGVEPWLPLGPSPAGGSVAEQRDDSGSLLVLVRDLIALRRGRRGIPTPPLRWLPSPPQVLAWRRGAGVAVLNLGDSSAVVEVPAGVVVVGTRRERGGELVDGGLALDSWEGAVLALDR